jgi:queuine/archaeosine tRNA-ribosyltransferase
VDHLVVDYIFIKDKKTGKRKKKILSKKEKNRRIQITLKNAEEFLKLHLKRKYNFIPIGVAQGYDLDTYKNSVKALVEMGYEYIGIGGLVQYKTEFILEVLREIQPYIDGIKIHLFGVSRPNYLRTFKNLGVASFDSASFFRKAWLRSGQNYLAPNGRWYTAIRVPQASDPRILKNADLNGISLGELRDMEKEALQALIKYDQGLIGLDDVLNTVLRYDNLLLRNTDNSNLREKYRNTLMDMPWKKCNCDICKNIGIHVVIFRGCNRNKRRGFHNIWTLRKLKMES